MKYNGSNLQQVLEAHYAWLRYCEDNLVASPADFRCADLTGADLCKTELRCANMTLANLRLTKFVNADLWGADLYRADLERSYLNQANLRSANLQRANLRGADLSFADLHGADLSGANLQEANLLGVDLRETCIYGADLRRAKNVPYVPIACPEKGPFIAWKKCYGRLGGRKIEEVVIVKLLIPDDAKRLSGTTRKCRSDKAVVLAIETLFGEPTEITSAHSLHSVGFEYIVGYTVFPENPFCEDRYEECSSGIHFFVNRQDAVEY